MKTNYKKISMFAYLRSSHKTDADLVSPAVNDYPVDGSAKDSQ